MEPNREIKLSLISKFTKAASKTPLEKIANQAVNDLERRLEGSVNEFFTKALSKTGVSSSVSSVLSARFGDSLQNDLSDKYFRTSTSEQNRLTCEEIRQSITPRYAETTSESINRLDNNNNSNSSDVYQFPDQIGKYYIHMKFREYTRTSPQSGATLNFKNSIILPVPRKLEERFSLNVNDEATGVYGAVADLLQTSFGPGGNGNPFESTGADAALAYSYASTMIPGEIAGVAGSYLGSVPNPNMATFFNGINMRNHSFEWTFTPRNKKESYELMKIIERLKQNSLPAFSPVGTAILQYPYLCFIELHPWAKDEGNELIRFKPCLLRNMSYNYAPNGIPSFFEGTNLPTFISISLEFLETEYFTSNDYGRSGRTDDKITEVYEEYVKPLAEGFPEALQTAVTNSFPSLGANTGG